MPSKGPGKPTATRATVLLRWRPQGNRHWYAKSTVAICQECRNLPPPMRPKPALTLAIRAKNAAFLGSKRIDGLRNMDSRAAARVLGFCELAKAVSAAAIVGAMAVTFALSLAAIFYAGTLAPFLSQGIGLTLIGAAVMAVVGPFTLSYRGTPIQPQHVSTILLSISAGAIATLPAIRAQAAFSTVVALAGATSMATGVTACAMGLLKLGYLVRFGPFPVVSGFLAASGVLLVRGAFRPNARSRPAAWSV